MKFKEKLYTSYEDYLNDSFRKSQILNSQKILSGALDSEIRDKAGREYDNDTYLQTHPRIKDRDDYINTTIKEIKNNNPWATIHYRRNTKKQGIHENCQIGFLQQELTVLINNKYKTPSCGIFHPRPGTLYVKNGIISKIKGETEGIDLMITYSFKNEVLNIYGAMKHIDGQGTSQNNQFSKLLEFAKEFRKIKNPDVYTISILDGTYYKNRSFFPYRELARYDNFNNFSGNCDKSRELIKQMIISWLQYKFPKDNEAMYEVARLNRIKF